MFKVDNDKCYRCGICTGIELDVFQFNDEGNIQINNDKITEDNMDQVMTAINSCPAGALQMVMDDNAVRDGFNPIENEKEDN